MKRFRPFCGWVVSLILHLSLFFVLPDPVAFVSKSRIQDVTLVELLERKKQSASPQKQRASQVRRKKAQSSKVQRKKRLVDSRLSRFSMPSYISQKFEDRITGSHSMEAEIAGGSESASSVMGTMSLKETLDNQLFFQELAKRLHIHTDIPDGLIKNAVQGKSTVEVMVNYRGEIQYVVDSRGGRTILVKAALLNIYRAFQKPLPSKAWMPQRKYIPLKIYFDFQIYPPGQSFEDDTISFFKNSMTVVCVREVLSLRPGQRDQVARAEKKLQRKIDSYRHRSLIR